jgi:hypothetical protein
VKAAMILSAAAILCVLALSASPVLAEPGPIPPAEASEGDPLDDGWKYDTYYLYPLTRHIDESGVTNNWRYALYPITVVMDTAQLPFGALAGLFGD